MMGRKRRLTRAHVENMKRFHVRPQYLRDDTTHALLPRAALTLLKDGESIDKIHDRRATEKGDWEYQLTRRDGTIGNWVTEEQTLQWLHPNTLDSFHALYEIKHEGNMPHYAVRNVKNSSNVHTQEEALTEFPKGTVVVREADLSHTNKLIYVWGTVKGYQKPYWRVRYTDGEWEDLSKTELKMAITLADVVGSKGYQNTDNRQMILTPAPVLPDDFGTGYEGEKVKVRMSTGWCKGILIHNQQEQQSNTHHTFDILFNGESKSQLIRLKHALYNTDESKGKQGAWHILLDDHMRNPPNTNE
jgi:hypothetical protein